MSIWVAPWAADGRPNWQVVRQSGQFQQVRAPRRPGVLGQSERGTSLVLVLLLIAFAGALAGVLVWLSTGESLIAAHGRVASQARAAADAALHRAAIDLQQAPDWNLVLSGTVKSSLADLSGRPAAASGGLLDLGAAGTQVQARSDALAPWGPDRPRWKLFAYGPLQAFVQLPPPHSGLYLLAWVADDGGDGDGDPTHDANGILQVWAEARGPLGTRRAVTAGFARIDPAPAPLRCVWWRDAR